MSKALAERNACHTRVRAQMRTHRHAPLVEHEPYGPSFLVIAKHEDDRALKEAPCTWSRHQKLRNIGICTEREEGKREIGREGDGGRERGRVPENWKLSE